MSAQAWAALAAMLTAALALGGVVVNFIRSASSVGLGYLERALQAQQEEIVRQKGEIGELRGQLKDCRDERTALADRIAELEAKVE